MKSTHSFFRNGLFRGPIALLILFFVAGCSVFQPKEPPPEPVAFEDDPAIQAIRSAVDEVQEQHALFVQVTTAHKERPVVERPDNIPEFERPVTLRNWHGPVAPALMNISADMGYDFDVEGKIPPVDPIVSIDVVEKNAFDALNLIVNQGNNQYRVRVNVPEKLISLIYE